jgi:hypothetical protein
MQRSSFVLIRVLMIAAILSGGFLQHATAAPEDYAGAYTCTFSGDMSGIAIVQVDTWGSLYGLIWSDQEQVADYVAGWATVDGSGNFAFTSYCGMTVEGSISEEGAISGTWDYLTYEGTLDGDLDTGSIEPYAGDYTIDIKGDHTGTCDGRITSDGQFSGDFEIDGVEDADSVYMGMVDSQGNIIVITNDDTSAKGQITSSGAISGTWSNEEYSGTFSTQAVGSSGGSGGGGGGGGSGCFITSLLNP